MAAASSQRVLGIPASNRRLTTIPAPRRLGSRNLTPLRPVQVDTTGYPCRVGRVGGHVPSRRRLDRAKPVRIVHAHVHTGDDANHRAIGVEGELIGHGHRSVFAHSDHDLIGFRDDPVAAGTAGVGQIVMPATVAAMPPSVVPIKGRSLASVASCRVVRSAGCG